MFSAQNQTAGQIRKLPSICKRTPGKIATRFLLMKSCSKSYFESVRAVEGIKGTDTEFLKYKKFGVCPFNSSSIGGGRHCTEVRHSGFHNHIWRSGFRFRPA